MARINLATQASDPSPSASGKDLYPKADGWYTFDENDEAIKIPDYSSIKNKNMIINGGFDIWQRGTTFSSIGNGEYSADRFEYGKSSSSAVNSILEETTEIPSTSLSTNSLRVYCATADTSVDAGDAVYVTYNMEGYDYRNIKGKTCTLSFWVSSPETGVHCVSFRNNGYDRSYVAEYTVNTADTWEYKSVTLTFDQTGGTEDYSDSAGMRINWALMCGTDRHATAADTWENGSYLSTSSQVNVVGTTPSNFRLSDVQLELGSVATDFEYKNYADTLRDCQRYCQAFESTELRNPIGMGYGASTTIASIFVSFTQNMRDVPTLTATASDWRVSDGTGIDLTAIEIAATQAGNRGAMLNSTVASGLTQYRPYTLLADATASRILYFESEL